MIDRPASRLGGFTSLLGWRLAIAAVMGGLGCGGLYVARGSSAGNAWASGAILLVAILAGLVWEIATQRIRCGFVPLK